MAAATNFITSSKVQSPQNKGTTHNPTVTMFIILTGTKCMLLILKFPIKGGCILLCMPNAFINVSPGWSAFTHHKTRFLVYFIAVMVILTVI